MKVNMCFCAAVLAVGTVAADTYTWITPTNVAYHNMGTAARWEGGVVPSLADGHSLDFSSEPMVNYDATKAAVSGRRQTVEEVRLTINGSSHVYDRIWGGYGRMLSLYFAGYKPSPNFTVNDPNDFEGLWWLYMPWDFTLNATAAHTPILRRVQVEGAPTFVVPTAGTSAVVSNFLGRGTLCKAGTGTLKVAENEGPAQNVRLKAGTLEIAGAKRLTDNELAAVLNSAAFHVDATKTDSLVMDGDRITQWRDVRGAGYPYGQVCSQNGKTAALPWCAANALNNLNMVDFGAFENDMAVSGQMGTSAAMAWSTDFGANYQGPYVLEAFVVASFNDDKAVTNGAFFANLWDKSFRRYSGAVCTVGTSATSAYNLRDALNARDGDFALTGVGVRPSQTITDRSARIFSFRAREDAYTRFSGFAVDYGGRVGGLKIGEAVYFTNFLSRVERRNVLRYLQKKWNLDWNGGEAEADVGTWLDESSATAFTVPADQRLGVREIAWRGSSFEKNGAGELAVGTLYPQDETVGALPVTVSGGKLSYLGRLKPSANPAPAADAFRHYDADDPSSFVATDGNITEWKDQSGDVTKSAKRLAASRGGAYTLGYPKLVAEGGPNGHAYVDLGAVQTVGSSSVTSGAFLFDEAQKTKDTSELQEVFMVLRRKVRATSCWFLGSYLGVNCDFHPAAPELFRQPYSHTALQGGEVTKNGRPIDPIVDNQIEEWSVLRLTPLHKLHAALIGADRGAASSGSNVGGFELGEVILYSRRLTRQEEIDTEAYLVKKWLGKDHPLSAAEYLKSLTYTAAADPTLNLDADLTVGSLAVAGTSFTKTGAGALRVGELSGNASALTVTEGAFALPDESANVAFHFDAMDVASFETFVTGEEGQQKTNVVSWADTRRNGVVANAVYRDGSITNPTLQQVEMRPGVWRPTVDFGVYAQGWSNAMSKAAKSTAGMVFNTRFTNIREAITVHAATSAGQFLFCDTSTHNYHTGGSALLHGTYSLSGFRDPEAIIRVNGESQTWEYIVPTGTFNLFSLAQAGTTGATINQIALDRKASTSIASTYRAGGMRCSEQIGFSEKLTEAQRAYWTQHLMYKWFGVGTDPVITNRTYTSLTLGPTATLTMPDNMLLEVSSLTGGGTITGRLLLEDSAVVTVTLGSPLTVQDRIENLGTLSIAVVLPEGVLAREVEEGVYPLITTANFACDLSQVSLSSPFTGAKRAKLVRTATGLGLVVQPKGVTLLLR